MWSWPGIDLGTRVHMEAITAEEQNHLAMLKRRFKAYDGNHPASLKVRSAGPNDNLVINYCKAIVDKGVSFLFGQDLGFETDSTTQKQTPEEKWLAECLEANRKMSLLQKLAMNGAISGHAWVRVYPPNRERFGHDFPRIIILSPDEVWPFWDQADIDDVSSYRVQWNAIDVNDGKPITRRQIIFRQNQRWNIRDEINRGSKWEELSSEVWPWAWCPIFHCQNLPNPNEFWGLPDLTDDLLKHQGGINFVASNMLRIIRNHAHPKTYATGMSANAKIDFAADDMLILPGVESKISALEMVSDLSSSQTYLDWLVKQYFAISRVPEAAMGAMDTAGVISGTALEIKFQSLLEKTETKRVTYGDMLRQLVMALYDMVGMAPKDLSLVWPNILPSDQEAELRAAETKSRIGVSRETILTELGYDPQQERERRQVEAEEGAARAEAAMQTFMRGGRPDGRAPVNTLNEQQQGQEAA